MLQMHLPDTLGQQHRQTLPSAAVEAAWRLHQELTLVVKNQERTVYPSAIRKLLSRAALVTTSSSWCTTASAAAVSCSLSLRH